MSSSHLHKEDFGLLIEAGFIAVKQGSRSAAKKLFEAAYHLEPSKSASKLGFGYLALNELQLPISQKIFETVLKEEPKNALAKVLLGFAFLMERFQLVAGKKKDAILNSIDSTSESVKKGELLIKEALQESLDSSVQNLGLSALELAAKVNAYLDVPLKK
ncbi:MAG: SctF chaperone SctG [Chlamydiae bacterium]|nr:SctF chaperone SctG [Chlamydiota bacterium]